MNLSSLFKTRISKNRLFRRILIVLSCMVLILSMLYFIISLERDRLSSQKQIENAMISNSIQLESYMKELTDNIRRESLNLSLTLSESGENFTDQSISVTNLNSVKMKLSAFTRTSKILDSIYLYFEEYGYVITSTRSGNIRDFYDKDWIQTYVSIPESEYGCWLTPRNSQISWSTSNNALTLPFFTYVCRVSNYIIPNVEAGLVFNVDEKRLADRLNSGYSGTDSYVQVIDSYGTILCDPDTEILFQNCSEMDYISDIINNSEKQGLFTSVINGEDKTISWYRSDFEGWIFVTIDSANNMKNIEKSDLQNILLITGIILLAGIVAAIILSFILYNPLNTILEEIRKNTMSSSSAGDIELLEKAAFHLKAQQEQLNNIQTQGEEDWLRSGLLNGYNTKEPLESLKDSFSYQNYCVLYVRFDSQKEKWQNLNQKELEYIKMLFAKLFQEILSMSEGDSRVVFLGNEGFFGIVGADHPISINKALHKFLQYALANFKVQAYIGASRWKDSIASVFHFSDIVKTASQQYFIKGWNDITYERDIEELPSLETLNERLKEEERTIIESLNTENEVIIISSIKRWFLKVYEMDPWDIQQVKLMLHQMTGVMIQKMFEIYPNEQQVLDFSRKLFSFLSKPDYLLQDFETYMCNCISSFSFTQEQEENLQKDIYTKMIRFVQEHFCEDIGTSNIAESVGVSYSYARKVFKDKAGINIPDYINDLRIAKAKQMLLENKHSLVTIMNDCGFNNMTTFLRTFKRIVGETPSEYKNMEDRTVPSVIDEDSVEITL